MTDRTPSWHDLNAYADGELPTPEAAGVARAVAEDPGLAHQVATLARLKATVHELGLASSPAEAAAVAEACRAAARAKPPAGRPARRDRAIRRVAVAAAAALAVVLAAGALLIPLGRDAAEPTWRNLAVDLHRTWAAAESGQPAAPTADSLLASLSQLGQAAQVPDLSGARLTVGYLRPVSSEYGHGLHIGYRGTRGCRVSLIILPAVEGLSREPAALAGEGRRQHAWRVGELGYALLATGMDPRHYQVVLQSVYEASRSFAPIGPETRTALVRSRARSRPCAA